MLIIEMCYVTQSKEYGIWEWKSLYIAITLEEMQW